MPGIHEEVNSASTQQEPWAVKIFARLARSGKNGISKHVREMYYATTAGQFVLNEDRISIILSKLSDTYR